MAVLSPTTASAGLTYLQLVNRARQECGVGSTPLATLQTGLTGEGQRFTSWVADAWRDLQLMKPDWNWMRVQNSFNTVSGQWSYSPSQANCANVMEYLRRSFRCYTTVNGEGDEQILPWMTWDVYRNVYRFGNMATTSGRPTVISTAPDHSLAFGPVPDNIYTVSMEYFSSPTELVADSDNPANYGLPAQFHLLMVYRAMQAYAGFESAPEVMERGQMNERRLMSRLYAWAMTPIISGPPLA